jgi:hypothetical protein
MLVVDRGYYVRAAAGAMLTGEPFENLATWAAEQRAKQEAAKVVNISGFRARLRPTTNTAER